MVVCLENKSFLSQMAKSNTVRSSTQYTGYKKYSMVIES